MELLGEPEIAVKALGRQSFDKHTAGPVGRRKRNRIRWQRTPIQSLAHIPSYHRDNLGPDQYEWALKPHHGAQVLPMIAISNMAASILDFGVPEQKLNSPKILRATGHPFALVRRSVWVPAGHTAL